MHAYFFPDILPATATNIPTGLMRHWQPKFEGMALSALAQNPINAGYLMSTSKAAYDPLDPMTVGHTTSEVLWYDVFAMENAKDVLGGSPFDNTDRIYSGSADDAALNAGVHRYKASPTALANLQAYQTTGQLTRPLVSLHTTLDPVVPYDHEAVVRRKGRAGRQREPVLPHPRRPLRPLQLHQRRGDAGVRHPSVSNDELTVTGLAGWGEGEPGFAARPGFLNDHYARVFSAILVR